MNKKFITRNIIGSLLLILASTFILKAQGLDSLSSRKLLLRDSLDFLNHKLSINTFSNEFSPIPFKGGLLYISNKPIKGAKVAYNKIYWTENPNFKIIEQENETVKSGSSIIKFIRGGKTDDFTAPTSNDNNILVNYKRLKYNWNNVERNFLNFSTDQSFAYDDSTKVIVYSKMSNRRNNGKKHWELWQALLINGRLKQKQRIVFNDKVANYLNPFLNHNSTRLYFASDKIGTKGGYDIFYVDKKDNNWQTTPIQLDSNINTIADEVSPSLIGDSLYFSSNRNGGVGGFDIYFTTLSSPLIIYNAGYPLNSIMDEVDLKKISNLYYLTTNRTNNFDVLALQYLPAIYSISGVLTYKNDGSLATNHTLFLKDVDADKITDTLLTDDFARYNFNGKPNRNYEFITLNGDSVIEKLGYETYAHQKDFNKLLSINGRSPKQIKDSIQDALALATKKIQDSINNNYFGNKFVVYFGFDKNILTDKEKLVLDSLSSKLNTIPNSYVIIGAFTDCVGSFDYNYKLSEKRAKYVLNYLKSKGIAPNRFVSNGYSKNYTITPCAIGALRGAQQSNRRAEIVLSETKKTNWAILEKERGANYYSLVNSKQNINPKRLKLETKIITPLSIKIVPLAAKVEKKKDIITKLEKKKDTITEVVKVPNVVNKVKVIKTVFVEKINDKVADNIIIATGSSYKEEYSKEDILKALDSLATLKKAQERIIEYMTKRINKKPIIVFVNSDTLAIELYDNAIHDKDSVSIIYNNRLVVDKQELKVNKPIKFNLKLEKNKKNNELVMVAENLGAEPPNTAVMFITEKSGKRQQVMLATDMTHNEVVYFIRIGKQ